MLAADQRPRVRHAKWAIGTAVLGRPAYINTGSAEALPADRSREAMRDNAEAVLDAAMAAGIDWVDTARSYGEAEAFVGDWMNRRSSESGFVAPTVSSKWGYAYVGEWRTDADVHEVKDQSIDQFRRQWAQTQEQIGAVVGLYQVHSLTVDSPLFDDHELIGALAELPKASVAVGFSTSGPRQADAVRRALSLTVDGRPLFSAVQSTWNLLEPSVGAALAEAKVAGMTVLLKECLANGTLMTDPPESVAAMAAEAGVGADAIALAAAARQPFADRVLLGPADRVQLASNLLADRVELTADQWATLRTLAEPATEYWERRAELPWR
ncbi:MAG: aldo/keto reductase [Actinomycetota bacterium]|nr:aldo/keto reductase [Actinomycetota bacterium]